MKPLFNCELHYFPSKHLMQIYDGFGRLSDNGIINLNVVRKSGNKKVPLLTVLLDQKYKVIYDTLDGMNWVDGTRERNIEYFKRNYQYDYYFKRSFDTNLSNIDRNIFPLGFNYTFTPTKRFPLPRKKRLKIQLEDLYKKVRFEGSRDFHSEDFEYIPVIKEKPKVLFLARLWDPDAVKDSILKDERFRINEDRIRCIEACNKKFGDRFLGGLKGDDFSEKVAEHLIVPGSVTNKDSYLKTVKDFEICIATTGLHESIGWKFGEYIAASRAIISEPLAYEVPGNFKVNQNYLEFNDQESLIESIDTLLRDREKLREIMYENFLYYNNYVRSDRLVLNSLLTVRDDLYNKN